MPFKIIQAASELPKDFDLSTLAEHRLITYIDDVHLAEVGGRLRANGVKADKARPWTLATSFADNTEHDVQFQLFYLHYPCGAPIVARMRYAPTVNRMPACRLPGVRASDFAPNEEDFEEEHRFAGVRELMVVELPDMAAAMHLCGAGKWTGEEKFYRVIADLVHLAATLVRAKKSTEVVVLLSGTCYSVDRIDVTVSETQEAICDYLTDMYRFRRFVAQPRDRWNDYATLMCAETTKVITAWATRVALEEEEDEEPSDDFSDE